MGRAETDAHLKLKHLAVAWARTEGFSICGLEVSLPRCGFRADAAAVTPGVLQPGARAAIFECKQSRADCLRDAARERATAEAMRASHARLLELRDLIAMHRPDLRKGESLFPEFDAYDYTGLRHETLSALETELRRLQRKWGTATKFDRMFRYAVADFFFLVTEDELIEAAEVPCGWGWLCREGDRLSLRARPVRATSGLEQRIALLERIGKTATRGLPWRNEAEPEFEGQPPPRSFAWG